MEKLNQFDDWYNGKIEISRPQVRSTYWMAVRLDGRGGTGARWKIEAQFKTDETHRRRRELDCARASATKEQHQLYQVVRLSSRKNGIASLHYIHQQ